MLRIPLPMTQLLLSAINHVMAQQPMLRERLASHAGAIVRILAVSPGGRQPQPAGRPAAASAARMAPSPRPAARQMPPFRHGMTAAGVSPARPLAQLDARVGVDGTLTAVSGEEPAVVLTVCPSVDALFRVLREGPLALGASLRIEGDVMLAQALGEVTRTLHWDVEEDLSRLVGDVAAHRAGSLWRHARAQTADMHDRFQDVLTDHLTSTTGVLISRAEFEMWSAEVNSLAERLDRLDGGR